MYLMQSHAEYDRAIAVVRDVIHEWDPYSLIDAGSPSDEWDCEIASVVAEVSRIKSPEDATNTVSRVFSAAFQPEGFGPVDCKDIGCRLFSALRNAGIVTGGT